MIEREKRCTVLEAEQRRGELDQLGAGQRRKSRDEAAFTRRRQVHGQGDVGKMTVMPLCIHGSARRRKSDFF